MYFNNKQRTNLHGWVRYRDVSLNLKPIMYYFSRKTIMRERGRVRISSVHISKYGRYSSRTKCFENDECLLIANICTR